MRATGPSVVIIQHLKSMGIKLRMPKKTVSPDSQRKASSGGLFGVPLQSLPPSKEGEVPQLVVEICQFLGCHLSTEGLFRKSGSVNRIKALKSQVESGESCLSSAHPSDVAALLKQFFRELPQPLLTPELQDSLCQIQQSLSEEERGLATTLVTCLLPTVHMETLKFFCTFLQNVASRCEENRMDSGNLAVVLAPSLFSTSNLGEKLTPATEKQLQLQASAIQSLIEHAQDIGQLPLFISEKISLPCDAGEEDSVTQNLEGLRRKRRRSMSGLVKESLSKLKSGRGPSYLAIDRVTDEVELPQRSKTKRKASEDSGCGELCTPKKRKSLVGLVDDPLYRDEPLEPNVPSSPVLDDTEVFFDSSPANILDLGLESPAILPTPETSFRGKKGRAKRRNSKRTKRMQSGHVPASPAQLDRKEKVRNSLRLFNRTRATKQPTPEGKKLEQSGWNLMKKMVAEALDVPMFNGRDYGVAPFSIKASNSAETPNGKNSPIRLPPTPCSLKSSPWKPLPLDTFDIEATLSGRRSRSLRRSLSMPEIATECVESKEDGDEASLSIDKKCESQDDGLIYSLENPYVKVQDGGRPSMKNAGKSYSLDCQNCEFSSFRHVPALRMPIGHTSQYRSVRKLVLSFPWMPSSSSIDVQQKDLEMLATHPIKRKGARKFGRSISQETGLGTNEGQSNLKIPEDGLDTTVTKPLGGRNRQVFVSRKTITIGQCGQHSLEAEHQESVEDSTNSEIPPSELLLPVDEEMVGGERQRYRTSPKWLIPGSRLEPVSDIVDL